MTTPAARHGAAERRRSRSGRALLLVLVVAAVAAAWQWLAPAQFGGQTTYALVTGQSMEPTLASGTLVVARSRESYHTGQIALRTKQLRDQGLGFYAGMDLNVKNG